VVLRPEGAHRCRHGLGLPRGCPLVGVPRRGVDGGHVTGPGVQAPGSAEAVAERKKASVRKEAGHPFRVIGRQVGHVKARYRGLAKNGSHLVTLFALSNLWMARRTLLAG